MSSDHEKGSSRGHYHPDTSLSWSEIEFKAKSKTLIQGISGTVRGGEMVASELLCSQFLLPQTTRLTRWPSTVLGPSGAGKSTLLDVLAGRKQASSGRVTLDGCHTMESDVLKASSYVEQDDALLGVLSVRETVEFSARLSQLDSKLSRKELKELSEETIISLGLSQVAGNHVGTPISRGISGGQRRRLTVANSFVSLPKVLFLDEPVSGLDSYTAYEVMAALQRVIRKRNIAVIATIHSPTWETFSLFDRVLLLAGGKTMYYGTPTGVRPYFKSLGHSTPENSNPADHMMTLVNGDFSHLHGGRQIQSGSNRALLEKGDTEGFGRYWQTHNQTAPAASRGNEERLIRADKKQSFVRTVRNDFLRTGILIERNLLNYSRNLLAFGVRFGMYFGMGLMLATIWIRLPQTDTSINDRLSVLFYSVAFLGFMSVAGIPAFLEERAVYVRERKNNLYGPFAYVLAQTLCNLPFLFICACFDAPTVVLTLTLFTSSTQAPSSFQSFATGPLVFTRVQRHSSVFWPMSTSVSPQPKCNPCSSPPSCPSLSPPSPSLRSSTGFG